jgi:gluconate kinase
MSAVQIAGCSGAGKSAIAAVLARRGLVSIDADVDPLLARFVDAAGTVVTEVPSAPDLDWLARHGWAWDSARLDELIRAAGPATLYVCGGADNQEEVADRFSRVFLLEIDEPTMLARLDARRDHHDWGRIGDTREYLRRKLPALQDRLRASGAIPIDARQSPDQVADAILARAPGTFGQHLPVNSVQDVNLACATQAFSSRCAESLQRHAADPGRCAARDRHLAGDARPSALPGRRRPAGRS